MPRSIITLFLALLVFAHPAFAADECTSRVFDSTGKLTNVSDIDSALGKLSSDGAFPLIRVITSAQMNEQGNLEKYIVKMKNRCPSWQSAGGNLKTNIFVIALVPEGTVGVYFSKKGPFQNSLQGKTEDIRSEMAKPIAKGDLSGAIKAGIARAHDLLSAPKVAPIVANGPVTIVNHNEKPADLSFMKWLIGAFILGAAVWLFFFMRSRKDKRQAARQKAQVTRANCNNLINGFDERMTLLGSLLNSYKSAVSTTEFQDFQSQMSALDRRASSAKSQFASSQGSANDPESVGLSAEQYDAMTETFERSLRSLSAVGDEIDAFEATVKGIGKLRDQAKPAIDALTRDVENATNSINAERVLKTDGPRATLQQATNLLERAKKELEDKSYQAVANTCRKGTALANKAAQQVRELASRKNSIELDIQQLDSADMSGKTVAIDAAISDLRTTYGESEATPAFEQRTVVIEKLAERQAAIAVAKSGVFTQNWDLAEQKIAIAKSATSSIDNAIGTVQNMGRRLNQSRVRSSSGPYRTSSGPSRVTNTTVVNNYGGRDRYDDSPGFGTGVAAGVVGALAVESLIEGNEENRELRRELREERREDRGWGWGGGGRSRNDDEDLGGGSGNVTEAPDNEDEDIGGDSNDTSTSNNDSDNDVSDGD